MTVDGSPESAIVSVTFTHVCFLVGDFSSRRFNLLRLILDNDTVCASVSRSRDFSILGSNTPDKTL